MSYSSAAPVEAQFVVAADGSIMPAAQVVQAVAVTAAEPLSEVKGRVAGAPSAGVNVDQLRGYLHPKGWPEGMVTAVGRSIQEMPLRYFIVDDSGSMSANDGHRLIGQGAKTKLGQCSRWTELGASILFHANMAHHAQAPTEFRLLNGLPPLVIGQPGDEASLTRLAERFDMSPGGGTPLCHHIRQIVQEIRNAEATLRANGQRACIVICTDGESSDGSIAEAMKPLERLPCWVVVRLCTDDDSIVDYWNNIDSQLEVEMDVLDDFVSEAKEIMSVNSWLVYGEPLHRLREWGIRFKELDLLDEAKLSPDQMRFLVAMIFTNMATSELPHPTENWSHFKEQVRSANDRMGFIWNPTTKGMSHWVSISKLGHAYGNEGWCVVS